jgi:hypothetical protein
MRLRALFVLAWIALGTPSHAFEHAIPIVELGSASQTKDGFRAHIEAAVFPASAGEGPGAVPLISFVAHVPLEVGRTHLGIAFLEVEGGQGQTLLSASLDRRVRGKLVRCSVDVEKRLAADCVLHFQYMPVGEARHFVKDYVVRLKYYIPRPR